MIGFGATTQHPVHVSVDLETVGLQPNAAIVSVGLAAFTLIGGVVKTFYGILNVPQQRDRGRVVDAKTVEWWQRQSPEAREAFNMAMTDPARDNDFELQRITDWFRSIPSLDGVWGFGADFDNAALQSLFRDYGLCVPWPYKLNRCGRTITSVLPMRRPPNVGTQHNALDDAIYQANTIRDSLMRLETLKRGVSA